MEAQKKLAQATRGGGGVTKYRPEYFSQIYLKITIYN